MSNRFILVLFLTGISVTIFFFFLGNNPSFADTSEILLTNLLYQNDYILYFVYILIRFKPLVYRQSLILLLVYFIFFFNGILGSFNINEDISILTYTISETSVRALFTFYFIKYLNLDIVKNKVSFSIALIAFIISLVIFYNYFELLDLPKIIAIIVFYSVISMYLFTGSVLCYQKIRNKVFFSIGVLFTFISDFFTLLNLYFQVEVYIFTVLRLVSIIGEFLVIYVILEELKSKKKYKYALRH